MIDISSRSFLSWVPCPLAPVQSPMVQKVVVSPLDSAFGAEGSEGSKPYGKTAS